MASEEQCILDGLTLNDATFGLAELSCPPPRERQNWIGAADSEAQLLADRPKHDNRDITLKIQVAPQANMNTALDKVGQLVDKCVKASKYPDGIELTWTPATSTRTVTFDVLSAEITDLPIDWQDGWLALAPTVTIVMKAKPYWRGTETLTSTTSSSTPIVTAELANSSGDVPALGRLIVTDTATQSRRHVEWGLEGPLTYNASTSLIIDSDSLVVSGFAGAQTTGSGAYDPNASGNSAIRANPIYTSPVAVCGTGDQSHIGTFRVKARVQSSNALVRLSWQVGDGPLSANQWTTVPLAGPWCEIDLGTITVPAVLSGTQRWKGTIEAYSTGSGYDLWVDYLILVPVTDGYGKATATYTYRPGVMTGFDDFTGTTSGSGLNGRTASLGGTWATSGVATDFTFQDTDPAGATAETVQRSTATEATRRFAVLGSTAYSETEVHVDVQHFGSASSGQVMELGLIARWVDSSNYLAVYRRFERDPVPAVPGGSLRSLRVEQVVAGVTTVLADEVIASSVTSSGVWHSLAIVILANGQFSASHTTAGVVTAAAQGQTSVLATGGALDDGKPGIFDKSGGTIPRAYDNFSVATPAPEPIVLYSGRNIQFRHDDTVRQDSTGTYTGRPPKYMPAGRFLVPVGTSRVLVKARRNNVDIAADENVTDATQLQVGITPRGLAVPR